MKKYKRFIGIFILLLILVLGLFVASFFFFSDIKSKNENISELTAYLSSEMNREDYVISTQRQLQSLEEDINILKNSIVSSSGDVQFIENLEMVARKNNLSMSIDSIMIEKDPKLASSTIDVFKIKATTEGTWSNTYKFLNQLEALPYKIRLNYFNLSGGEVVPSSEKNKVVTREPWEASFEIRVLKYK
ncbi:MAG TPA: hypothetical protein VGC58_00460 [Candidatus Paceibacterota bacterium]